ncbi:MAG: carboxypeptidase regulatory-like domain-containing protein, partial [Chitinophagales bacterium]
MQNNLPTLFIAIAFNLFALNLPIQAQTDFGAISGTVTDAETGETLPFVNATIEVNGALIRGGATSDFDGVYTIHYIPEGVYGVHCSYIGYRTKKIEGVVVTKGDT